MPSSVAKQHGSKKRAFGSRTRRAHESDEEELEARLFGTRKQRKTGSKAHDDDGEAETGLGWMQDSEVRRTHATRDKR